MLMICVITAHSQKRDLKNANLAFEKDFFTDAIYLYDLVLNNKKATNGQLREASRKKALALYKNIAYRKAKEQWDQYVAEFDYKLNDIELFYYAQSLIQCGEGSSVRQVLDNVNDKKKKKDWIYNLVEWQELQESLITTRIAEVGYTDIKPFHKGVGLATDGENLIIPRHSFVESAALTEDYTKYQIAVYDRINQEQFQQNPNKLKCLTSSSNFYANPYTDGELIYFGTVENDPEKKDDKQNRKLRLQSASLSCAKNVETKDLDIGFKKSNNSFPFLYQDSIMFFASDHQKKDKGFDIMYSIRTGDGWSDPKGLDDVNTFENDIYPMVHDGKFYFSSKGRPGYGGMDIYRGDLLIEGGEISVTNIQNAGRPVNSNNDDFALVIDDDETGYFMSNRSKLNLDHVMWVKLIDPNAAAPVNRRLVFFEYDRAELSDTARMKLDGIAALLQQQPALTLKLEGHADTRGTKEYNMKLSENRNIAVADYLATLDIDSSRIAMEAFGETKPINTCGNGNWCYEEEYALNRRVEVEVIADGSPPKAVEGPQVVDVQLSPKDLRHQQQHDIEGSSSTGQLGLLTTRTFLTKGRSTPIQKVSLLP